MNETKSLRWRSLLAFLVPALFAVFLMQPAQVGSLTPQGQPGAALVSPLNTPDHALRAAPIHPDADLAALLTPRWCVRTTEQVSAAQPGDVLLLWEGKSFVFRPDRQYLVDKDADGLTRQILGKPLYEEILPLLDVPDGLLVTEETP